MIGDRKFDVEAAIQNGIPCIGVTYGYGSKEELKKSTWDILDECGQVGVIIGDDCTVPNDIDDDRFNWVREACAEYAANH